jgi:hypothetical protein
MTTRGQILRSSTPGQTPAAGTRLPGELWTNFPDLQFGVIDASRNAQKLIAVRYFSTLANYAVGDFVIQAGALYVATVAVAAGAFNSANWSKLVTAADAASLPYVPTSGGNILGNLSVSGILTVLGSNSLVLNALTQGQQRAILAQTNGASRWQLILADGAAEGGANSGSNFTLNAIADGGSVLRAALTIARDTGVATFGGPVTLAGPPTLPLHAATKAYVDSGSFVPIAGNVAMTGPLTLAADPAAPLQPVTKQYVDALPVAMNDNRLINGDMRIDQRHNGASGTATAAAYTVDRWVYAAPVVVGSWGQNSAGNGTAGPSSFPYCLGFVTTSPHVSAATDYFQFVQTIEADMVSDFAFGTTNAQPVTLSFWAYCSLTGTFSGALGNAAGTRSYPFTFSLPTANTWTKIALTIPGDTGGTWVMSGNAASVGLHFDLGSGANYRAPAGAWVSTSLTGATGSVSVVATNGAFFAFTGVKLEVGSVATPYNRQSLAKSMADCQRYFRNDISVYANAYALAGNNIGSTVSYSSMRIAPTITFSGASYANASGIAVGYAPTNGSVGIIATATVTGTASYAATVVMSAEL